MEPFFIPLNPLAEAGQTCSLHAHWPANLRASFPMTKGITWKVPTVPARRRVWMFIAGTGGFDHSSATSKAPKANGSDETNPADTRAVVDPDLLQMRSGLRVHQLFGVSESPKGMLGSSRAPWNGQLLAFQRGTMAKRGGTSFRHHLGCSHHPYMPLRRRSRINKNLCDVHLCSLEQEFRNARLRAVLSGFAKSPPADESMSRPGGQCYV